MSKVEHPMQPIVWAKDGVIRFKENRILRALCDDGTINLNRVAVICATHNIPREDQEQLAQLIGYSVSGFGDLSYARPKTIAKADAIADAMARKRKR